MTVLEGQADVSSTDAFCALYDSNGKRRPLYVRGLNDIDVLRNSTGLSNPSPGLIKALNNMLGQIYSLGWCIQWEQRPPTGGLIWNSVLTVTADGNFSILGMQAVIAGLIPGSTQIVFQGIPTDDLPGFPRIATVVGGVNGPPQTIIIPYRLRTAGAGPYLPTKLKCCVVVNQYTPITNLQFESFGERKTGRAFGVPRGRSRVKIKAQ